LDPRRFPAAIVKSIYRHAQSRAGALLADVAGLRVGAPTEAVAIGADPAKLRGPGGAAADQAFPVSVHISHSPAPGGIRNRKYPEGATLEIVRQMQNAVIGVRTANGGHAG